MSQNDLDHEARLEEELKIALVRRDVSPDFTRQVLQRVASLEAEPQSLMERWRQRLRDYLQIPAMRLATGAVMACLVFGIALSARQAYQKEKSRREGEIARAQVLLALQITSLKLNEAKKKVNKRKDKASDEADAERESDKTDSTMR
jgi:hypothetical protein